MARAIPSVRWMLSRGLSSTQLPQSSSSTLVARMEAASLVGALAEVTGLLGLLGLRLQGEVQEEQEEQKEQKVQE